MSCLLMMAVNLSNIAILKSKGSFNSLTRENEGINLMQNADSTEKTATL